MKKHIFGRQLSRDINERKALFKGLINALVMQESIRTTEAKAKAIRAQVEKLITKAKRKGIASKSLLQPWLHPEALEKVMSDLAVRFAKRPGGYTRILTIGERFGDNATMVVIEFVEKKTPELSIKNNELSKKTKEKTNIVESTAKVKTKGPRAKKSIKKEQRPPSKSEIEKRSAGKGSPKKESK